MSMTRETHKRNKEHFCFFLDFTDHYGIFLMNGMFGSRNTHHCRLMRYCGQRIKSTLTLLGIGILLGFLLWKPAPGYAELYKYFENGVVHYTNRHPQQKGYEIVREDSALAVIVHPTKTTSASSPQETPAYGDLIEKIAKTYQLNPDLVKAIITVESNYNKNVVSRKGAQGLMQLMPATAERFGVSDVFDPKDNITGGVKFLRYLLDEFGEDNLELVLAGYNAGEEAVHQYDNKIPPYEETQQYVKKVLAIYPFAFQSPSGQKSIIYKYVDKNGVLAFTNVQRVMKE
jgi:hypothetical protein